MAEFIEYQDLTSDGMLRIKGNWQAAALPTITEEARHALDRGATGIDASGLGVLDTAGAWLLDHLRREASNAPLPIRGLRQEHSAMLDLVSRQRSKKPQDITIPPSILVLFIMRIGEAACRSWHGTIALLRFIGETSYTLVRTLRHPGRIRIDSIVRHVDETGINAIPIIALIAFLISVVVAYQSANQLRNFGAEIFTVNMIAVSTLREMAVLLTAIMVAGRSGSAFTAEIGVMKVNEEVDAMQVIGLNPFEVLVLPRLMALMITMPILTFIADMMGALGGGIVCYTLLDITPVQYIERFRNSVQMWDFWVGMIKAPVFAFLISVVGCMRGMEVSGSAESVGKLTTVAVVHSIFLVLLADALFSILFTNLGI